MSNFFSTANLKVKEQKILHSTANPDTSMMQVFESMRLEKENESRIKSVEEKMEKERKEEIGANIAASQMLESYLVNLTNQLYTEGKEVLFKDIMSSLYLESVYLDDSFKEENAHDIKETMVEYIDKHGGFAMLEQACKKRGTKLLNDMKSTVEKTARKCAMRKTSELKEACASSKGKGAKAMEVMNNKHSFDMVDEEVKEYHRMRETLSEDEVVKLVRDKVLDVLKDEKTRQKDIETFEAEIAERAEELEGSETQQKAFKETAMNIVSQNVYTDMTLFEAIQFSTMKEVMESCGTQEEEDCYEDIEDYIDNHEEEMFDSDSDLLEDDEILENTSINMDLVLAESITKYTLLELCHTIKLEEFDRNTVQQICVNLSK